MPGDVENVNGETESLLGRSRHRVRRFFDGFIDFAFQGNILQIAFGLMCGPLFQSLFPFCSPTTPANSCAASPTSSPTSSSPLSALSSCPLSPSCSPSTRTLRKSSRCSAPETGTIARRGTTRCARRWMTAPSSWPTGRLFTRSSPSSWWGLPCMGWRTYTP